MVSYGTLKSLASTPEIKLRIIVRISNLLIENYLGNFLKVSSFNNCTDRPILFYMFSYFL